MLKLMAKESDEYKCLYNALRKVEEVADYINEMQRISETYTPIFQELCKSYTDIDVSIIISDTSHNCENRQHMSFFEFHISLILFCVYFLEIRYECW